MNQDILENGFQPLYDDLFMHIDEEELARENYDFVRDVFDMYEGFRSYEERNGVKIDHAHRSLEGFDGNNEGELVAIARFLVERQRKWKYLGIKAFDSHSQSKEMYTRMLSVWLKLSRSVRLTALTRGHVDAILAETIHPTNRN